MSVLRGILVGGVTSAQTGTGTQEIGRASVSGLIPIHHLQYKIMFSVPFPV